MKVSKIIFLLGFLAFSIAINAKEIHVASNGNDSNIGTQEKPLLTIQAAINKMQQGDICIVHKGVYRETITIKKSGTESTPLIIKAAKGENPVISGLDIINLKWKETDKKGIYVADFSQASDFEQLFLDGKPLLEARWPNVPKDKNGEWDFFSPKVWAVVDAAGNHYGTIKDKNLAATGWNVSGAKAVLNVCHQFFSWTRTIESHTTGSDSLLYAKNLGKSIKPADETGKGLKFNDDRYYLIGKKEFLDAPGEWYFDKEKHQLFLYTPDSQNPNKKTIEIKIRNFGIIGEQNANFITINGITFWGTAFKFGKDFKTRSNAIEISDNKILYSSCTEYLAMPDDSQYAYLDKIFPTINADNSIVKNNEFAYGTLSALFINGFSNLIENNIFHDFDLSSSLVYPPLLVNKNQAAYEGKGGKSTVRFNTIYNSGGILTQIGQNDNNFYMNDLYNAFRSCYGGNKDVSALYSQSIYCRGTRLHHNWVHEGYCGSPPYEWNGGIGIRGDDNTSGLTIDHNVVWNIGSVGIMIKNTNNPSIEQANKIFNNTLFQHSKFNTIKSAIIVSKEHASKNDDQVSNENLPNTFSSVKNNLAESIYGSWFGTPLGKLADFSANSIGKSTETSIENSLFFDFRPKLNADSVLDKAKLIEGFTTTVIGSGPDIGAYERGDKVYWIPGRKLDKASFPIVPDGSTVSSNRDVLMWRTAYNVVSQIVYFGTDKDNLEFKIKLDSEKNVFNLPNLSPNQNYFWRIDSIMQNGMTIKGDVWNFKVNP
jgi:hypothetical protein